MKFVKVAMIALAAVPPGTAAAEDAPPLYSFGDFKLLGRSPHYVDVGLGVFDVFDKDPTARRSGAGRIELRLGRKVYGIGPAIGAVANTDGGAFGYGAVYADIKYHDIVLTPLVGMGAYHEGNSSDLGGVFQFRLALGVTYQFANQSRLGLTWGHISNADIHDKNPGQDELYLSYALPF